MSLRRYWFPVLLVALLLVPSVAEPEAPAGLKKVVTFAFENQDVQTVVKAISMFAGVKATVGGDIKADVTIHLEKASVRNALAAIAATVDAVVVEDGNGGIQIVRPIGATEAAGAPKDRPVQFEFTDTPLHTVVTAIAVYANVNLVYNCDCLKEKTSLSVKGIGWRQALEQALGDKYTLVQEGDVFRIEKR